MPDLSSEAHLQRRASTCASWWLVAFRRMVTAGLAFLGALERIASQLRLRSLQRFDRLCSIRTDDHVGLSRLGPRRRPRKIRSYRVGNLHERVAGLDANRTDVAPADLAAATQHRE